MEKYGIMVAHNVDKAVDDDPWWLDIQCTKLEPWASVTSRGNLLQVSSAILQLWHLLFL